MGSKQFDRQTIIDAVTNKSMVLISEFQNSQLASGVFERHIFYSPPGTISRLVNVRLTWDQLANPSGFTGMRQMYIDTYDPVSGNSLGVCRGQTTDFTLPFYYDEGGFQMSANGQTSAVTIFPNDPSAINIGIHNVTFDEHTGISCTFSQTSGQSIGEARRVLLFVEREVVSR